jgi:protein-disulfide isomerase
MEPTSNSSSVAIPLAIVFGFGLIAVAIYFSGMGGGNSVNNLAVQAPAPQGQAAAKANIRPVDETDFIKGNPNAPIMIVEYSDYDCPFCKRFHETMNQIMNEYGVTGKVAWVYRQLPLTQLHPNAAQISEAALCVGEVAGNDAFWKFSDLVFEERSINEATNITKIPDYANRAGADKAAFEACLDGQEQEAVVRAGVAEGAALGINGTPSSFVLIGNQQAEINGAQPYEVVKGIIENLIGQLEGEATPS